MPADNVDMMISRAEFEWLGRLGRDRKVVELGCWLGGSTTGFLDGGAASVTSYDRFTWGHEMDALNKEVGDWLGLKVGDGFMDIWKKNTGGRAIGYQCDLHIMPPMRSEVLFIDAMKGIGLVDRILQSWVPLVDVGGLVVEQDFRFSPGLFATKFLGFYLLRDSLVYREHCDTSVLFEVVRQVPRLPDRYWWHVGGSELKRALDYYIGLGAL